MLTLDQKVVLNCTDTGKDASGTIVRIVGGRVDVMLDGGATFSSRFHAEGRSLCWLAVRSGIRHEDVWLTRMAPPAHL